MQVLKFLNILKEQKAESYYYFKKKFDTTYTSKDKKIVDYQYFILIYFLIIYNKSK